MLSGFNRILAWIREALNKMLSPSSVKDSLKLDVAITPLMADAQRTWALMYRNQSPWLSSDIQSLNLAAAISSRVASTVTLEMKAEITGGPRGEYLNSQFIPLLAKARNNVEVGLAKGGLMFKPYVRDEYIYIDCIQADMFYPVAFDSNGCVTSAVFADQKTRGTSYYTRLEYHAFINGVYVIRNLAYKSTSQNTIGSQCNLGEVAEWADLEPEAMITGIDKPLFSYFKTPFANNIDETSPLGVSIYSRAAHAGTGSKSLMQQADEVWSNILWEIESAKRAVYTETQAFGVDSDGKPVLPDRRLYRLLDLQSRVDGKGFFEDWTPTIRINELTTSLEGVLRKIEFNCGLSYGVISDPKTAALTATEIRTQKQEYYVTITDTQKALRRAYDDLLYSMDIYATLYDLAAPGEYKVTYQFDDSVLSDHDTQFTQDSMAVTNGNMPKYIFNMRNFGLDEATAKKWVADAKAESPAPSFFPSENIEV